MFQQPYATIERDGIVQSVTYDELKAMLDLCSREELIAHAMRQSDQIGLLKEELHKQGRPS